ELLINSLTPNRVGTYTVKVGDSATSSRIIQSRPITVEIGPFPGVQSHDKPEDVFPPEEASGGKGASGLMKAMSAMSALPPFVSVSLGIPGSQTMNNTNSTSDIDCFNIGNATRWLGFQITSDPNA